MEVKLDPERVQLGEEADRERVLAGMARARAKGTKSGKPIGRPAIHPARRAAIRAAYEAGGVGLRAVAPNPALVSRPFVAASVDDVTARIRPRWGVGACHRIAIANAIAKQPGKDFIRRA